MHSLKGYFSDVDDNDKQEEFENVIFENNLINELEKTASNLCLLSENKEKILWDSYEDDVKKIAKSFEISGQDQECFVQAMLRFRKLFAPKNTSAGQYEFEIKVKSDKIIVYKTYPIPIKYRNSVDKEIMRMLDLNIIEKSTALFCSPLRIVIKGDGTVRVCLDARYINKIIESENETPPLIYDIMQKFHGIKFISTTDLANGYWQIPLHKDSRKYSAFLHNGQMYQFCRIPFGIKTAGSGFIRALNFAMGNKFESSLTPYIDDLLITTKGSFCDHIDKISEIFYVLQDQNFTLRLDKSLFCRESVKFLGFELSLFGIRPDTDKLSIIRNFAEPRNKTQLQSFLGRCNYYRQFVARYSIFLEPFRNLLKEKHEWMWTNEHIKAYNELKNNLADSIMLNHYIPGQMFKLQTDASSKGISGILYQTDEKEDHYVIMLISRCLSEAETHYSTTELELLAIIYSVVKCRTFLMGNRFEIKTDHKALTFLNEANLQNSRLIRWSLTLQEYTEKISC